MGRIVTMTMGLLLAAAALAAPPAGAASASGSIVAWWQPAGGGSAYEDTYSCAVLPAHQTHGNPLEVYNTCDGRIWLHYYDDGDGQTYDFCVNPGGFLAYGFNESGGFLSGLGEPATDFQVTTNPSPCDAGQHLHVTWLDDSGGGDPAQYNCEGEPSITDGTHSVYTATNNCAVRVWLHKDANGQGSNPACLNPGNGYIYARSSGYFQLQDTAVQAQCSAGGAPYSY
jgi:hypothetical protein